MDDFTLTDKNFCKLIRSIYIDETVTHIKVRGHGNSMTPFLKTDEILFIRPVYPKDLIKIGDIVAVTDKKQEKIIVHRVINKKKNLIQTKGDNCKNSDGWVQKNRIIGVVTRKKRISGKYIYFQRWQNLFIAFLSITGFINTVVLPFGRLLKKNYKAHKK